MRKFISRRFLLFMVLIYLGNMCYSQSIEYVPICPIDKPFPTFFFSYKNKILKRKKKEFFVYEFKLSREKFDSLYQNISANLVKATTNNAVDYLSDNYGAYKLIVKTENHVDVFILDNKSLSRSFFENQLVFFRNESSVTDVILDSLKKRLE